jgi:uncharacterized membrane protein
MIITDIFVLIFFGRKWINNERRDWKEKENKDKKIEKRKAV